jgi:hypothetical protein
VFSNIEERCELCVERGLHCGPKQLAKAHRPERKLQDKIDAFHKTLAEIGDRWHSSRKKSFNEILRIFDPDQKPPINDILEFFGYGLATSLMTDNAAASQLHPATGPSFAQPISPGNPHNGGWYSNSEYEGVGHAGGVDSHIAIPNGPIQPFPSVTGEMCNSVISEFDSLNYNFTITAPDYAPESPTNALSHGSNSFFSPTALSGIDSLPPHEDEEDAAEDDYDSDEFGMKDWF